MQVGVDIPRQLKRRGYQSETRALFEVELRFRHVRKRRSRRGQGDGQAHRKCCCADCAAAFRDDQLLWMAVRSA